MSAPILISSVNKVLYVKIGFRFLWNPFFTLQSNVDQHQADKGYSVVFIIHGCNRMDVLEMKKNVKIMKYCKKLLESLPYR